MLGPARLKLIVAVTAFAYAFLLAGHARGQDDGLSIDPKDIPKLVEMAKQAGMNVEYEKSSTVKKASGSGAGAKAEGGEIKQGVKSDAPGATIPGESDAKGGSSDSESHTKAPPASVWSSPFLWLGVVCEGLALACWFVPLLVPTLLPVGLKIGLKVPIGLALAGGAFIFAALQPAMAALAMIGVFVFLAGPKLLTELQRLREAKAAQAQQAKAATETGALFSQSAQQIETLKTAAAANLSALDEVMEAIANDPAATLALKVHLDKHADDPDKPLILERAIRAGVKFS